MRDVVKKRGAGSLSNQTSNLSIQAVAKVTSLDKEVAGYKQLQITQEGDLLEISDKYRILEVILSATKKIGCQVDEIIEALWCGIRRIVEEIGSKFRLVIGKSEHVCNKVELIVRLQPV